jgi:hypothetical protein
MFVVTWAGCAGAQPTNGGTEGVLHAGNNKLSEIQITVHQMKSGSSMPIGFGVPSPDGSFRLVTNGAAGPLYLSPGEYRFTLESIGAPIVIPKAYAKPETTPLKVNWSASDRTVDLDIPRLAPIR